MCVENIYIYIWNDKYLANITDNSVISCDEIIEEKTKMVTVNINEKMQSVKLQKKKFYFICLFINYYFIVDSG